jgi:hypothetical protein
MQNFPKAITIKDLNDNKLLKKKSTHTQDHINKLFKVNKYTCITISGSSSLNEVLLEDIIKDYSASIKDEDEIGSITENLKIILNDYLEKHLARFTVFVGSRLIISHFSTVKNTALIFQIIINKSVVLEEKTVNRVIYSGQSKIADKILQFSSVNVIDIILKEIQSDLIAKKIISEEDLKKVVQSAFEKSRVFIMNEIELLKIRKSLSLQEAVNFACLLMKIVVDFQHYYEILPTVGGTIRIAVINKDGFSFIKGDKIRIPEYL